MKKKTKKLIIIGVVAFVVISISSFFIVKYLENNKKLGDTKDIPVDQTSVSAIEQFTIISDNVKLRQESYDSSAEIAVLKIGDKVEVIRKSTSTSKVSDFQDYWYNIKFNQKTGWVFGEYICSQDKLNDRVQKRFERYLKELPVKDFNVVSQALKTYKAYANLLNDKNIKDNMFRNFRSFYENVMTNQTFSAAEDTAFMKHEDTYGASLYDIVKADKIEDNALKEKVFQLRQNGFRVSMSEGNHYVDEEAYFLLSNFSGFTSDGIVEFLTIRSKDIKEGFAEDAALIITWDKIGDRIALWDNYINKFPGYPEAKEAKTLLNDAYIPAYVVGANNTPAYDFESRMISNQVKQSYEQFMQKYPNSSYYSFIKGYYDILKRNNFYYNSEAEEYLRQKGIKVGYY